MLSQWVGKDLIPREGGLGRWSSGTSSLSDSNAKRGEELCLWVIPVGWTSGEVGEQERESSGEESRRAWNRQKTVEEGMG